MIHAIITFPGTVDQIQNGSPDGLTLVNTATMKALDSFSYEGACVPVMVPNVGMVNLVEGTVLPANTADNNVSNASLARLPNGYDGNNAATDWIASANPTPGAANVP